MRIVVSRVADYISENPAFRKQVAKLLISEGLLEEGYTLSSPVREPEVLGLEDLMAKNLEG